MIALTKIGHVNLRVADIQTSKAFYFPDGRGDGDFTLAVSRRGEPLPAWLMERWPRAS